MCIRDSHRTSEELLLLHPRGCPAGGLGEAQRGPIVQIGAPLLRQASTVERRSHEHVIKSVAVDVTRSGYGRSELLPCKSPVEVPLWRQERVGGRTQKEPCPPLVAKCIVVAASPDDHVRIAVPVDLSLIH